MAVYGLAWVLPSIVGTSAAGLIFDNYSPFLLWYLGAVICAAAIVGFILLHCWLGEQEWLAPHQASLNLSRG